MLRLQPNKKSCSYGESPLVGWLNVVHTLNGKARDFWGSLVRRHSESEWRSVCGLSRVACFALGVSPLSPSPSGEWPLLPKGERSLVATGAGHIVAGRNPAPPQKPWNDSMPQCQQTLWFQPWLLRWESDFATIHRLFWAEPKLWRPSSWWGRTRLPPSGCWVATSCPSCLAPRQSPARRFWFLGGARA